MSNLYSKEKGTWPYVVTQVKDQMSSIAWRAWRQPCLTSIKKYEIAKFAKSEELQILFHFDENCIFSGGIANFWSFIMWQMLY